MHPFFLHFPPFVGIGEYDWKPSTGGCAAKWVGHIDYVIINSMVGSLNVVIITVTSVWTFMFTRGFLRKTLKRQQTNLNSENFEIQKKIYNKKLRNLNKIFGALLLVNMIVIVPIISLTILSFIIGLENVPDAMYSVVFVLYLSNNVTNPIIQSYFRNELYDTIKKTMKVIMGMFLGLVKVLTCCKAEEMEHTNAKDVNGVAMDPNCNRDSDEHAAQVPYTMGSLLTIVPAEDVIAPEDVNMPEDIIMPEDVIIPEDIIMPEDVIMPEDTLRLNNREDVVSNSTLMLSSPLDDTSTTKSVMESSSDCSVRIITVEGPGCSQRDNFTSDSNAECTDCSQTVKLVSTAQI